MTTTIVQPDTGQPVVAGIPSCVGARYHCLHVLANDNKCIKITKKTLEFWMVLITVS